MIEKGLIAFIRSELSDVDESVFLTHRKKDSSTPAIVIKRVSTVRDPIAGGSAEMIESRFQIECYSDNAEEALSLRDRLVVALDSFIGALGLVPTSGISCEGERDGYETDTGIYIGSFDLKIWH